MLSNKEFVAIFLLTVSLICILNACVFSKIVPTTSSYAQLAQQSVCAGTAYICILYALSTWLFHSNYSEPRQHIRLVFLCMLAVMICCQVAAIVLICRDQYFTRVDDTFDISEIHSGFGMTCRYLAIFLSCVSVILLTIVFVYLFIVAHRKRMEHKIRREHMENQ